MEALIIHFQTLFDDQGNLAYYASSPPLPPAPLEEPLPPFTYGSAHTKFSEQSPRLQINAPLPQTPISQTSTGDDFAPQLPGRPPASIHPSSRGNSGNTNGLSNTSPTQSDVETHLTSPTTFIPPFTLRPGRQGALTPVQNLRGTKGLDFSHHEIAEGGWTGPGPASPPLSEPTTPHPPPHSALPQSTFAQQQQQQVATSRQQPALARILTQEQPQPKSAALPLAPPPEIERTPVVDPESIASPLEASSSSMVDDGHSTDYASPISITPDVPTGPTLQTVQSQPLTQQEPQVLPQLQTQPQVPIQPQVSHVQAQNQPSPVHSLRQPDKIPPDGGETQDLPPSQLQ
jgi:hypothetical protein